MQLSGSAFIGGSEFGVQGLGFGVQDCAVLGFRVFATSRLVSCCKGSVGFKDLGFGL